MSANKVLKAGWSLVVLALLAVPAAGAGGGIIYNGVDVWRTPADGSTFMDFGLGSDPGRFLL